MLLFASGFSFAFGAIFVKTYRVFSIFKTSQVGLVKRRMLKDEHLLGAVVALFAVDILLALAWELSDPIVLLEKETYVAEFAEVSSDLILIPHYSHCSSQHYSRWCWLIYVTKGVLLLFGVYMAWSTRNVKIDVLNDSRYIAMNIYNVLLTSVVVLLIAELLKDRPTLWFVCISTLVLISTTSALLMLFIPKVRSVPFFKNIPVFFLRSPSGVQPCNFKFFKPNRTTNPGKRRKKFSSIFSNSRTICFRSSRIFESCTEN